MNSHPGITRVVNGIDDLDGNGFYNQGGYNENELTYDIILGVVRHNSEDLERDVFQFDLLNGSGKFVFTENQEKLLLDQSGYKISHNNVTKTFQIIDLSGYIYYFDKKEISTPKKSSVGQFVNPYSYISSWYVSKIVSPTKNEIKYTYLNKVIEYDVIKAQTVSFGRQIIPLLPFSVCDLNITKIPNSEIQIVISNKSEAKFISQIEFPNYIVQFNYSETSRTDLPGSNSLNNIEIKNRVSGIVFNKIHFQQSYFNHPSYSTPESYRLKLDAIEIGDPIGYGDPTTYSFIYSSKILFPRLSNSSDHFGFSLGKINPTTLPKSRFLSEYVQNVDFNIYASDRDAIANEAEAGSLISILYPTKSKVDIEYENHTIPQVHEEYMSENLQVNGVNGTYYSEQWKTDFLDQHIDLISEDILDDENTLLFETSDLVINSKINISLTT